MPRDLRGQTKSQAVSPCESCELSGQIKFAQDLMGSKTSTVKVKGQEKPINPTNQRRLNQSNLNF